MYLGKLISTEVREPVKSKRLVHHLEVILGLTPLPVGSSEHYVSLKRGLKTNVSTLANRTKMSKQSHLIG